MVEPAVNHLRRVAAAEPVVAVGARRRTPGLGNVVAAICSSSTPRSTASTASSPASRLLYLPPYSPDLNPIEQVFAKLKALLRRAATRTVDALWHAIGQALDAFSPAECAHYLAHAGYVPSNRKPL
jgi:transposase